MIRLALFGMALAAASLVSGCGLFLGSLDTVLEQAGAGPEAASKVSADAIDKATIPLVAYSKQPLIVREDFRARLNESPRMKAAGVKIGVWVAGDPPLTLGPDPVPPAPTASPPPESAPLG